ncbi:MarR family winged helix-turn-helix transcriptional regulator [Pseudooctadecabacter jejudonensis]|uniref:Transcriptional regulator SlyA n=1 Tax=Pseudooctadecabacter jejudonensis TaxID=1391910 RepID=A0A1Y5TKJ7_9RHOB|nr:MarR family winged helix-turn-helix transcriptional regulator [Pseudooctadecabacter jejudonensis]SLN62556.1 transcriptional regulator SlyA [Pseudooctadecabacter jejudonensis]
MTKCASFDLQDFMPYLLNQAAEATSRAFSSTYRTKYGMLQTEWRVLFHLGRYGDLTAKEICDRASLHKAKVSRAVHALIDKHYLTRATRSDDRRHEVLSLTQQGRDVFDDLHQKAQSYEAALLQDFDHAEIAKMRTILIRIAELDQGRD